MRKAESSKKTVGQRAVAVFALLAILILAVAAGAGAQSTTPPFFWHYDDCDGTVSQSASPEPGNGCQTYNGDVYENVDYTVSPSVPAQCTDIDSLHLGLDEDYLYVEWTLVGPYISGCSSANLVLEIDADGDPADNGGLRGDYYLTVNLATEADKCGSGTWNDISAASWDAYRDSSSPDNAGGDNPNTGFGCGPGCSDYDYGGGTGYDASHKLDGVLCRSVDSAYGSVTAPDFDPQAGFQLAIPRAWFTDPALTCCTPRARAWTSQSSSLPNNKVYWHDYNPADKLAESDTDIDNTEWLAASEARLIVDKVTTPAADPTAFEFSAKGGPDSIDAGFSLTDTSIPWDSGPLWPGSYSVSETLPDGWLLTDASCNDGSDPDAISLEAGETVTCTFYNRQETTGVTLASFMASQANQSVLVEWQTATEINTMGFNLIRAESVDGPRVKVNDGLITSQVPPGSPVGAAYSFADTAAELGVEYLYWLQSVETNDHTALHGPVRGGILTLAIEPGLWSLTNDLQVGGVAEGATAP